MAKVAKEELNIAVKTSISNWREEIEEKQYSYLLIQEKLKKTSNKYSENIGSRIIQTAVSEDVKNEEETDKRYHTYWNLNDIIR